MMRKRECNMKDFLLGLGASILAIFAPIKAIIVVTGVLIVTDLVTGILAARKRGEKISSAGLRRTATKVFVYNIAVISGFLIERYMLEDFISISKITAGIIGVVEFTSILENLNTINGSPIFKQIIDKLGSINDKRKK